MTKSQRAIFFISSSFVLSVVLLFRFTLLPQVNYEPDDDKRIAYAKDPALSDRLCRTDVKRAKKDVANGKIVFTQRVSFGTKPFRFEKELAKLCKVNGLVFESELISDFSTGETQGCYADYMDGVIQNQFGKQFKQELLKQADSLFIKNVVPGNRSIESWYCDEKPYSANNIYSRGERNFTLRLNDVLIKKDTVSGSWPHMDISFVIEKNGTIGNFDISYYSAFTEYNQPYRQVLFEKAQVYLKTNHSTWVPGEVAGKSVRTKHSVRIFFLTI